MFAIKRMFAGEFDSYIPDQSGEPKLWSDPKEAKAIADNENATAKRSGSHFRYVLERQGEDENWREREHLRTIDGTYRRHVFASSVDYRHSKYNGLHFLHLSQDDPTKVAFTPSEEYGKVDRQKRMKFSRYLRQYFYDLDPETRQNLISKHHHMYVPSTVHFAWTPDDIEWVYTHGPPSCMSHPLEDYCTSEHPVRAYGAGDLAIAYTMGDDDDKVRARVLVFPERKIYGRIYGDDTTLLRHLEDQGYCEDRMGFDGARLLAIEECDEHRFAAPYSDVNNWARRDGDYLVLDTAHGTIKLNNDAGIQRELPRCERCEEPRHEDILMHVVTDHGDEEWCESCCLDHAFCCDNCGERFDDSARNDTAEREIVCDRCADDLPDCASCGRPTLEDQPDPRDFNERVCSRCYDDAEAEAEEQANEDHHELESTNA